jgi:hypothetical protein
LEYVIITYAMLRHLPRLFQPDDWVQEAEGKLEIKGDEPPRAEGAIHLFSVAIRILREQVESENVARLECFFFVQRYAGDDAGKARAEVLTSDGNPRPYLKSMAA